MYLFNVFPLEASYSPKVVEDTDGEIRMRTNLSPPARLIPLAFK